MAMRETIQLLTDPLLCTVCRACLLACHLHHTGRFGTAESSVHLRYDADTSDLVIVIDGSCDLCENETVARCAEACVPAAITVAVVN